MFYLEILFYLFGSVILMMIVEYVIHRWIQHNRLSVFRPFYKLHAILHHGKKRNDVNIDIPIWFALSIAVTPCCISYIFLGITAPICFAIIVSIHARVWTRLHRSYHNIEHNWTERLWIYDALKRHHIEHHNHANRNYGAVFTFTDYLFGTKI